VQLDLNPDALPQGAEPLVQPRSDPSSYETILLYFSFVTSTTLGYGACRRDGSDVCGGGGPWSASST